MEPEGSLREIISCPQRPDRHWSPQNLLYNGTVAVSPGARRQSSAEAKMMVPYFNFPKRIYGVGLN
jgi:hypothetical protein